MNIRSILFLSFVSMMWVTSCSKSGDDSTPPPEPEPPVDTSAKPVAVWETAGDKSKSLQKVTTIDFAAPPAGTVLVDITPAITYQEIDGFGAALTGSSAHVINKNLSAAGKTQVLRD